MIIILYYQVKTSIHSQKKKLKHLLVYCVGDIRIPNLLFNEKIIDSYLLNWSK